METCDTTRLLRLRERVEIMEYPKDPDDGHTHKWQFAEGMDTKTDADPYIC